MGNYAPITKELRELMSYQAVVGTDTFKPRVAADPDAFDAACDNIDMVHASLEELVERYEKKVGNQRKQLAQLQDALHERNEDELKARWRKELDKLKEENGLLKEELDHAMGERDDAVPTEPRTIGECQYKMTVTSHLDFEGLARDLEEAARAVRSLGGDAV